MRILLVLFLISIIVSCSSIKQGNNAISAHLIDLKRITSKPIFNKSSKITINESELCKINISSQWSSKVSKRKGFYSVQTITEIDFLDNYKDSLFISAHDETEDGITIQRWSDLIEINLLGETEVNKVVLVNSNSDEIITKYNTDYVSIGVSEPDNFEQIAELLDVLNAISTRCKSL